MNFSCQISGYIETENVIFNLTSCLFILHITVGLMESLDSTAGLNLADRLAKLNKERNIKGKSIIS